MLRISQIKIPVQETEAALSKKIRKILNTDSFEICRIVKKSIDAREKNSLMYIYSVDVFCKDEKRILKQQRNNRNITVAESIVYQFPYQTNKAGQANKLRPVIVGAGPAGYFCALYLARAGYQPIVLERGQDVLTRTKDVQNFWSGEPIKKESNVSFGEGGAGTFSDGKLNTGIKDKMGRIQAVIDSFVAFGADEAISYTNKPHIGTDVLAIVMQNMRNEIISCGGEVRFGNKFVGFYKEDDFLRVQVETATKEIYELFTPALVLAIGHSARDTFFALQNTSLKMEPKAFAIGVRAEHLQSMVDYNQYGDSEASKLLPAADYKMTYRSSNERSVYSFCMCPGGFVVNASTDEEQAVVNGMSYSKRDGENANSAIVVSVTPDDFYSEGFGDYGVLAGVKYQEKYERLAYEEGNGKIPIQLFGDYKANKITEKLGSITPNTKGKTAFGNLNNCLPAYVNNAIIEGIMYFDEKMPGFAASDVVLSGIETRTSSPVRIVRNEEFMSSVSGIFPCGEGAGYAGGITSAAVDGIKVAEAVALFINNIK